MYENQIKNLESAIKQLDQIIVSQPDNLSEVIAQKIKYQEELSKLRRAQWEEQTQRVDYGDDR